ncbi:hypothetical protein B0H13DRAFT_2336714 [Mycena leptocephala]|nr:hypothetical protein B0H13DRAFT_2336714 [Mycena leptocephala]
MPKKPPGGCQWLPQTLYSPAAAAYVIPLAHVMIHLARGPPQLRLDVHLYTTVLPYKAGALDLCVQAQVFIPIRVRYIREREDEAKTRLSNQDEHTCTSRTRPWPNTIDNVLLPLSHTPRQPASATSLGKFGTRIRFETDGWRARPLALAQKDM